MTRAQLVARVKDNTPRTDKDSVIVNGLNEGLEEACKRYHFKEMREETNLSLQAATPYVALPSDLAVLADVALVDGTNSYPVSIKANKWISQRFPNPAVVPQSRPAFCWVSERELKLFVVPYASMNYTLHIVYYVKPTSLDTDGATLELSTLAPALVAYATGYLERSLGKFEEAAAWDSVFASRLGNAINADRMDANERTQEPFSQDDKRAPLNPWEDPFNTGR